MKHFKQLTLIILTLSLLLCGCGGTQENGTNDNTENNAANNNQNDNSVSEKTEYSLSEYLNNGTSIWYVTNGYGKDDSIRSIYVVDADGTIYYCTSNWTLGEAEQKDDADIIATVKSNYEESMTNNINNIISTQNETLYVWIDEEQVAVKYATDLASSYAPYLDNIKPANYKLIVESDSTGNNTESEVLAFQEFAPISCFDTRGDYDYNADTMYIGLSYLVPYESDKGATNCFQVYDSWYGGYSISDACEEMSSKGYLLTRVSAPKVFTLDEIGTAGIEIDVKPYELFEDITVDREFIRVNN